MNSSNKFNEKNNKIKKLPNKGIFTAKQLFTEQLKELKDCHQERRQA